MGQASINWLLSLFILTTSGCGLTPLCFELPFWEPGQWPPPLERQSSRCECEMPAIPSMIYWLRHPWSPSFGVTFDLKVGRTPCRAWSSAASRASCSSPELEHPLPRRSLLSPIHNHSLIPCYRRQAGAAGTGRWMRHLQPGTAVIHHGPLKPGLDGSCLH